MQTLSFMFVETTRAYKLGDHLSVGDIQTISFIMGIPFLHKNLSPPTSQDRRIFIMPHGHPSLLKPILLFIPQ